MSAYVVGTIPSERLTPVIEAAITRFEETKHLRDELQQANLKLDERKVVERAKGILMRQRDLGEGEAYKMLRMMAMKRNMKLADLSNQRNRIWLLRARVKTSSQNTWHQHLKHQTCAFNKRPVSHL